MTKTICIIFLIIFPILSVHSEVVKKLTNESDEAFVKRITKHEFTDTKSFARTKDLIKNKELLIAFVLKTNPTRADSPLEGDVVLNVFEQTSLDTFNRLEIIACTEEGGSADVKSFFYFNADSSPDKEIGVICHWPASHRGADCEINDQAYFFTVPSDFTKDKLIQLDEKKFYFLYRRENAKTYDDEGKAKDAGYKCQKSLFKNAGDVKKLILKAGIK